MEMCFLTHTSHVLPPSPPVGTLSSLWCSAVCPLSQVLVQTLPVVFQQETNFCCRLCLQLSCMGRASALLCLGWGQVLPDLPSPPHTLC